MHTLIVFLSIDCQTATFRALLCLGLDRFFSHQELDYSHRFVDETPEGSSCGL